MSRLRPLLLVLLTLLAGGLAAAEADSGFVRLDTDDRGLPRALQMAVNRYEREDGVTVELLGAVHVGDAAYYAELNDRFRKFDALLFELIAPENADFACLAERRAGLLSTAQVGLTKLLDLSYQLDEIDYGRPNFVHADLTPEQLRARMEERDESLYVYFWRAFFASVDEYARDPLGMRDLDVMAGMVAGGERPTLKAMMANQMTDLDSVRDLLGDDSDSAIVGARNERAIEVLRRELDGGSKSFGIFYGVAHMPDIAARLVDDLGFKLVATDWVDAWRLDGDPADSDAPRPKHNCRKD